MPEKILEVKNLKKSFGNTEVLRGIDFSLNRGEVLVIIGSSGSGKTTLLRCLNFLEEADCGEISVAENVIWEAGRKFTDAEIRKNRRHFGLVFQSFNLFPQYNVLKNVTLAPTLLAKEELKAESKRAKNASFRLREEKKAALARIEERARELIGTVGLSDKISNYPCELSGGQCQLTGEVLKAIRALKNDDRTMIVVTHEMEFARGVGDKIIYMADGIIEEMGTPEEVFGNPKSDKTKQFLANSKVKG